MISPQLTMQAATKLRQNLAEMVKLLRAQYEVMGKSHVEFFLDNIHDPSDGGGAIPKQFTSGFCKQLQNPMLTPQLIKTVVANLDTMNQAIAAEAAAAGASLVDNHAGFHGHGMNAGADRWIDVDCAHPINPGHDLIRRLIWQRLTGKTY